MKDYEKLHHDLSFSDEIDLEERDRMLKKKQKTGRKKKGGVVLAPTDKPTPNPTPAPVQDPTNPPTFPPTVPEFTIFANIMKDANMTDDEKVSLLTTT
jgi:hypothetical protein